MAIGFHGWVHGRDTLVNIFMQEGSEPLRQALDPRATQFFPEMEKAAAPFNMEDIFGPFSCWAGKTFEMWDELQEFTLADEKWMKQLIETTSAGLWSASTLRRTTGAPSSSTAGTLWKRSCTPHRISKDV